MNVGSWHLPQTFEYIPATKNGVRKWKLGRMRAQGGITPCIDTQESASRECIDHFLVATINDNY